MNKLKLYTSKRYVIEVSRDDFNPTQLRIFADWLRDSGIKAKVKPTRSREMKIIEISKPILNLDKLLQGFRRGKR